MTRGIHTNISEILSNGFEVYIFGIYWGTLRVRLKMLPPIYWWMVAMFFNQSMLQNPKKLYTWFGVDRFKTLTDCKEAFVKMDFCVQFQVNWVYSVRRPLQMCVFVPFFFL